MYHNPAGKRDACYFGNRLGNRQPTGAFSAGAKALILSRHLSVGLKAHSLGLKTQASTLINEDTEYAEEKAAGRLGLGNTKPC